MSNKPKNCSKVKNACKYCLQQVTNKNGLQCQGACKKWAHFKCLNYTPGKISDIKSGIIKILCPCPDCETTQEKEYQANPSFICSSHTCPANAPGPVKCDSAECPANSNRKSDNNTCPKKGCANNAAESQNLVKKPPPRTGTPHRSCMSPAPQSKKRQSIKKVIARLMPSNSSGSCQNTKCRNSNSKCGEEPHNTRKQDSMVNALQEMCGTVGKLSVQLKDLMGKINKLT